MEDFVYKELLATKWKAEDFRDEFDQQLVKCLEDLITCFSSDTSLAGVREILPNSPAPSETKRPKISLHSQRCPNSPYNLSSYISSPKLDRYEEVVHSVKRIRATNILEVPVGRTSNDRSKSMVDTHVPVSSEDTNSRQSSTKRLLTSPSLSMEVASQTSSRIAVEPPSSSSHRSTRSSLRKSPPLAVPDKPSMKTTLPESHEDCNTRSSEQSSLAVTMDVIPSRPQSVNKVADPRSLSRSGIVEKRVFQSAERLGGASRLASLGKAPSTLNNSGTHKSRLNRSVGASSQKLVDRSALVLAAREQQLAEKQRNLLARIKEDEERIKAAQETRKAQRDAIKRANEDRRQAAKMRALLVDNKLHIYKATAKLFGALTNEQDKENEATTQSTVKTGIANKTVEVRVYQPNNNTTLSATNTTTYSRPTAAITTHCTKTPAGGSVSRPLLQSSQTTGGTGARLPLQRLAQTHIKAAPANTTCTVKLVNNATVKSASVSQHLTTAVSQKPPAPTASAAPACIDTSVVETSFDVSKLNSDSDSDGDQPKRKVPGWCRRGNPELINTLNDIYNGKLRWQDEFLPACQIPFDITEVFHGYAFRSRPRTSSGIWKTTPTQGTYGPYSHSVAI